mmetsp:Transcript_56633/g.134910  ORF Transcript_56633/g.134910 Transcript_56633/m.134910 type:complete len:540 (+) Transcript_56633:107-1726(+)
MSEVEVLNLEDTKWSAGKNKNMYCAPVTRPLDKMYFTGENFSKYEPCIEALQKVLDTEGKDDDAWNSYEELFEQFVDFSADSKWDGKRYDIVLYGTSGYTGYLTMQYLRRIALPKNPEKFEVALAGRNAAKVAEQRDRNFGGTVYEDLPIIQASYDDAVSMVDLARSAKVIVNLAGPYSKAQGELMLDACCRVGTDYCDVSGELPWTFRALELDFYAKKTGAVLIPSAAPAGGTPDLLTYICAKTLREKYGEETRKAVCLQSGYSESSATSGGTLASRAAMNEAADAVRARMADAFAIGGFIPDIDRNGFKECTIQQGTGIVTVKTRREDLDSALSKMSEDVQIGVWKLPNLYAPFTTRMVRRSNALFADMANLPYGRKLNYTDFNKVTLQQMAEHQARVAAGQVETGAPQSMSVEDEKERLKATGEYYAPGEGPAIEKLGASWLCQELWAMDEGGNVTRAAYLDADPYFATARVAVETALCLVFDKEGLPNAQKGGVLTMPVACETAVAARILQSGAGFLFDRFFEPEEYKQPESARG